MKFFKNSSPSVKYIPLFVVLFLAFIILLPKSGHGGDIWCWMSWAKYIHQHGLGNVYKSGTDYLPLYHYILFFFGKFQGNEELIERYINSLKVITLTFDFIAGAYLIKYLNSRLKDIQQSIYLSLFFFFNMAYFYNTLIWNQVDSIMVCFVFVSFYYALKQNILASSILLLLGINFKLQAIFFLPLIGLLLFPAIVKNYKKTLLTLFIMIIVQVLIIMPFIVAGDGEKLWGVITNSVGKYPVVSMNAFNFWYWVVPGDLANTPDNIQFLSITYHNWGLILFLSLSFLALFPLLKGTINILFCKEERPLSDEKLLLTGALIPFLFFFFNTQMHERYLHPAILFLAVYSLSSGKYFIYILGSLAYLINLEKVLQYWQLKNYKTGLFDPRFVAVLFLICIIYLFFQLYKKNSGKNPGIG